MGYGSTNGFSGASRSSSGGNTPITNSIQTTNGTPTPIATIPIPSNTAVLITANIVAIRTGGSSGSSQDSAGYSIAATYKNIGGTATEVGESSIFSAEDQSAWTTTMAGSGSNAVIYATGADNNNITWYISYNAYTANL